MKKPEIYYEVHGSSSNVLVLVMGFTASLSWWPSEFIETLSKSFKIITIDNRGIAKSPRGRAVYNMSTLASDITSVLDYLNIEKVNILGVSMGGMIAQEFTLMFPERVKKLLLFSTSAGIKVNKELSKQHISLLKDHLKGRRRKDVNLRLRILLSESFMWSASPEDIQSVKDMIAEHRPTYKLIYEQLRCIMTWDRWNDISSISCPVFIYSGTQDLLVNKKNSERIHAKINGSHLYLKEGLGHAYFKDETDSIISLILDFTKKS